MRSRGVVIAAAFSFVATAAAGQALPASGPGLVGSGDVMAEAFAPFPLGGRPYWNWSDLPFTISATESSGYNDNILGLAQGQAQSRGAPARGDFFSNTVLGASTKLYLGQQQFFVDGSYGMTRYRIDTEDDAHQYSLDAGVNWQFTSRCSGRLIAAQNQYQSTVNQQVGSGVNTVLSNSVSETATCLLDGSGAMILDSGWSSDQNSGGLNALNSNNSVYVRGGFLYGLTGLDTARAVITDTNRRFTDRASGSAVAGLADGTDQIDYQLFYERSLSPRITVDGMVGISQVTVLSATPGMGSPTQSTMVYSASLAWQATPKLSLGIASSRSVGAPTNTLSNLELETAQSLTVSYAFSAKTALVLGLSRTMSSGGITQNSALPSIMSNSSGIAAFCTLSYSVSPFLKTTASYQYSDNSSGGVHTKDNVYLLGVSFTPN